MVDYKQTLTAKVPSKFHSIDFQLILVDESHQDFGMFPVAAPAADQLAVGPWRRNPEARKRPKGVRLRDVDEIRC